MYCRVGYFVLLQHKPKLGCTKSLSGPHPGLRVGQGGLEVALICLAILLQGWPTSQRPKVTFFTVL